MHHVGLRLISERLNGRLFGQLFRRGAKGDLLGPRFFSFSELNVRDTFQLFERLTDVLFAASSGDSRHADHVLRGFRRIGQAQGHGRGQGSKHC